MSETRNLGPKKSVALSGVTAGNTALCTVGRTGNDLHYRGYDILEIATVSEFEEIAHLLVHEKLPNRAETPVRSTSIGWLEAGSSSSVLRKVAGSPRSDLSLAL